MPIVAIRPLVAVEGQRLPIKARERMRVIRNPVGCAARIARADVGIGVRIDSDFTIIFIPLAVGFVVKDFVVIITQETSRPAVLRSFIAGCR